MTANLVTWKSVSEEPTHEPIEILISDKKKFKRVTWRETSWHWHEFVYAMETEFDTKELFYTTDPIGTPVDLKPVVRVKKDKFGPYWSAHTFAGVNLLVQETSKEKLMQALTETIGFLPQQIEEVE